MPSLGRIILDPSKFFTFSHPSCERNPTELRHQHLQPFPQVWLATGHLLLSNQTGLALGECEGGWMKTKRSVKAFCLPGKGSSRGGRADVWDGWLLVGLEPHWWTSGWKVGDVFFVLKIHYPSSRHVTDVTNASRTMLMDIGSLQWSQELKDFFQLPSGIHLPKIQVAVGSRWNPDK